MYVCMYVSAISNSNDSLLFWKKKKLERKFRKIIIKTLEIKKLHTCKPKMTKERLQNGTNLMNLN